MSKDRGAGGKNLATVASNDVTIAQSSQASQ